MKFLLFGTTVGGNYGCDAIVLGTERILHHRFPDSEVWLSHGSWRAPKYSEILGDKSGVTIKSGWRDVRAANLCRSICRKSGLFMHRHLLFPKRLVNQSDCVLSIGGDLYTFANKEKDWPFPYPIMEAGNKVMALRKPYVVWCASVGPLEKAGTRLHEFVSHFHACRAIIVRESQSLAYLRDVLGLNNNVYLAADPAFVMEPESFDLPFLERTSGNKLVAINFSRGPMQHIHGPMPDQWFHEQLVGVVRKLLNALAIKVLLVPHVSSDVEFLKPIYRTMECENPGRIQMLPERIGARKTKWAVSRANALLTMRFHCALAGFSTMTPTMILVSTSKGAKICEEMYGDMDYALNIEDMNEDVVAAGLRHLLDNEKTIRARLAPICGRMQERAFQAGDIMAKCL